MDNQHPPNINSFVIRFVYEAADPPPDEKASPEVKPSLEKKPSAEEKLSPEENTPPSYRGTIRHIATGEEVIFTRWADAVEFIQRFVPIDPDEK